MKPIMKSDTEVIRRQFSYSNGEVKLNFQLRIDVKMELKAFLEMLKAATKDVEDQIDKVGKK